MMLGRATLSYRKPYIFKTIPSSLFTCLVPVFPWYAKVKVNKCNVINGNVNERDAA